MISGLDNVVGSIENEFLIFWFGEGRIFELLRDEGRFPFDSQGINLRWDWYTRLSENILQFLGKRFPELGQDGSSAVCDLQMGWIREEIRRIEAEHACSWQAYRQILASYAPQPATAPIP